MSNIAEQLIALKKEHALLPTPEEKTAPEALVEEATEALPGEEAIDQKENIDEVEEKDEGATGFVKMRLTNKALKEELDAAQQRLARLEGRFEERTAATAITPPAIKREEDPEPDPTYQEEHNAWELRRMKERNAQMENAIRAIAQNSIDTQHRNVLGGLEEAYAQANPDYQDARKFLRELQSRTLKLQYPEASDEQIALAISTGELEDARKQASNQRNPPKYFHDLAKALGYQPNQVEKSEGKEEKKSPSSLDNIRRNKEKSAPFIGTPSKGNPGRLTSEQLLAMTPGQYARLTPEEKEGLRAAM